MQRSGHADLPLHYGKVPPWLANRMTQLGRAIIEALVVEFGKSEVMRRLSDPLWFQSLGCVLGMDWHSSGITTSVMGALKRGLNPIAHELGIYICGGRGKHSRQTPAELTRLAMRTGLDGQQLVRASRLSAKIDNTAVQDGFQIYLHNFIVTDKGEWAVVQQGMNDRTGFARRYHWHSSQLQSFLDDPHTWVCGQNQGLILNLANEQAATTRQGILDITAISTPQLHRELRHILMPRHHDVKAKDIDMKRLGSVLALAQETDLQDFESMLLLKGLGPRTLQSLTLVSEVIYGTKSRFSDPARFSFAHGGKDGHPFPVPLKVYDEVIEQLNTAVQKAKIGRTDKQRAIRKLHEKAKNLEQHFIPNDQFDALIEKEWKDSHLFGGRTVMDDQAVKPFKQKYRKSPSQQLSLFTPTTYF